MLAVPLGDLVRLPRETGGCFQTGVSATQNQLPRVSELCRKLAAVFTKPTLPCSLQVRLRDLSHTVSENGLCGNAVRAQDEGSKIKELKEVLHTYAFLEGSQST